MKILLLGKNGQVGWELQRSLAPLGDVTALGSADASPLYGNLLHVDALAETVRTLRPHIIVNAAAHTAVDRAESEPDLARAINTTAPGVLAREGALLGAWLLHFSTDYVFDGSGTAPWREDAATAPCNVYGHSKLGGETAIRASGCRHLIFRTSWVYGARGGNFAKTMLKLAASKDELRVVADQHGAPTGAELLADASALALRVAALRPEISGTYHVAAAGETTWHGYAQHVIAFARAAGQPVRVQADRIEGVPGSAYTTPATRPSNSRLDTRKFQATFGLTLPAWQQGVDRMLRETLNV